MILRRIIRCSLRARFTCAIHTRACTSLYAYSSSSTAVLELVTRHYAYMVSGEYCKFSAFSTMVSRLALDHLTINYLNNNDFSPLLISTRLHVKALGPNLPRAPP